MTGLLVSVRNAVEARAALEAGVDLLDVKEPANGPLGAARPDVWVAVVALAGKKTPVSFAAGELGDENGWLPPTGFVGFDFVKFGMAGWAGLPWREELRDTVEFFARHYPGCRVVPVAYADWQAAGSPAPAEVAEFACITSAAALLIDTWGKNGSTLLDHAPLETLAGIRRDCQAAGVRLALAGSLDRPEMERLLPLRPDWFGVRGAICVGGRGGDLDAARVAELRRWLRQAAGSAITDREGLPGPRTGGTP